MPSVDIRGTRRKTFKIGGAVFDASAVTGTKTVTLPNADVTLGAGGGGGVTDHGALTGLADDDHPQYHNDARGDARYAAIAHVGGGGTAHANAVASGAAGFMSGADKAKIDGIEAGATANANNATLLNRANHTGTQAASTISDFNEAAQDAVGGGFNAPLLYNDTLATYTFDETAALGNIARHSVALNGTLVASRRRINLIEGANVTLTVTDDAGNEEVDVTIAAAGGGGSGLTQQQVSAIASLRI